MALLLGSVADDFTGATDLADTLVNAGLTTVLLLGLPDAGSGKLPAAAQNADAVVIALKTRSIPAADAVRQSLAAARLLRGAGAAHLFFKYCSTFDSTDAGNIGPVADALLDEVGGDFTIFCPAFPKAGRKLFHGHLFVGSALLSESGMQNHPLNPMTDPNLVRVLGRQTPHQVGLVDFAAVSRGAEAIRGEFRKLRAAGCRHAIVDAVNEDDLVAIGGAALGEKLALTTGGSGLGGGLAVHLRRSAGTGAAPQDFPKVQGPAAIVAGSCSRATLGQIEHFVKSGGPLFRVEVGALLAGKERVVAEALAWAQSRLDATGPPVLIAASEPPETVVQHQEAHGREHVGHLIESALAEITHGLVADAGGVRRLIVAGGETSSAAVERLGIRVLRIGPTIDPGVPWTFTSGEPALALALKSGNFGAPDFFLSAFQKLPA